MKVITKKGQCIIIHSVGRYAYYDITYGKSYTVKEIVEDEWISFYDDKGDKRHWRHGNFTYTIVNQSKILEDLLEALEG